jgi:Ca2+-binding EF-hand superfamily protein
MKPAGATLGLLVIVAMAGSADRDPKTDAGPVVLLPGTEMPCRLRLEVMVAGGAPTAAWDEFLARLFAFFDRDGDGSLSRDEVARLFPLPLPDRKSLTFDFARLDPGNGKVSLAELKAYCRANGFTPVVAVVEPPSAADLRLGEMLFARLDANGDGKLDRSELKRAPELLRKYDLNEDEYLDLAELLAAVPASHSSKEAPAKLGAETGADAMLRVDLGAKGQPATIGGTEGKRLRLEAVPSSGGLYRLRGPEGRWTAVFRATRSMPDLRAAGEFLAAQLETALAGRESLSRADLEQDSTLSGLQALFPFADRNGDNRLSLAELKSYLDLIERGMRAQVWIRITDHGRNPFPFLDTDGDGRLSYREQTRMTDLLGERQDALPGLPRQFELTFGAPVTTALGGVQVPAIRPARPAAPQRPQAPRWFTAMDRNNDGVISPREFLGPPELFRKLDTDGDGVISPVEAMQAERR